ncbi:MAG: hypothetical protein FD169_838 [Bacillota bacterium]|nr:MAG: hypothetical protein FD169_838 [Bacillota bacterium]
MLNTYEEFKSYLQNVGFMPLSNNKVGFPSLSSLTAEEAWHTNEANDPWIWRRVIAEEKLAAYGKFFDKKPSFITLEWLPYFLAVRRGKKSITSLYETGKLSTTAKNIYALLEEHEQIAAHDVKPLLGLGKDSKTEIENAMIELQMGMFVTISDMVRKVSADGSPYGWPSVCLMKIEDWVGDAIMAKAAELDPTGARAEIIAKAREFSPDANEKQLTQFLTV